MNRCSNEMDFDGWVRGEMVCIYCKGDKGLRENTMTRKISMARWEGNIFSSWIKKKKIHGARKQFSEMWITISSPSPEGFLQGGSASIVSMHTRFNTHDVFTCGWKTAYCAYKRIWICLNSAGLLRGAAYHECFIVLNNVIFFGLFKFNIDAASRYIFEDKVGRCLNNKMKLASCEDSYSKTKKIELNKPSGVVATKTVTLELHPMDLGKHERTFTTYFVAAKSPPNWHWSGDADFLSVHFFTTHPPSSKTSKRLMPLFPAGAWSETLKLVVLTASTTTPFGSIWTSKCQCWLGEWIKKNSK